MSGKKQRVLLIVCACLLVFAIICCAVTVWLGGLLESQYAHERWRGENEQRFAQVSCFFPVGSELDANELLSMGSRLDEKLLGAGLESPDTGCLYVQAYSAKGKINVSGTRGETECSALGIGGDFFVFHPLRLRSGSYISGDDLMEDRVLLDEELAWKLFGGVELEGMTVTIDGRPFYVAGVVERETDFASQRAYSEGAGIFMSYDVLLQLGAVSGVSCYELVCADPISGFAKTAVSELLSADGTNPVVENSSRFTLGGIIDVISSFGTRSGNTQGVIYPYWENAARMTEDYMALCLVLTAVFAALPAGCACVLAVSLLRRGRRAARRGIGRLVSGVQERSYARAGERLSSREKRRAAEKRAKTEGKHVKKRDNKKEEQLTASE